MSADGAPRFALPETTETEQRDLARAQAGDERAFEALFARYRGPIFTYLYRSFGDRDDAEDFTQDTFVKAWKALPSTTPDTRLGPWLYRIAHNVFLDAIRHRRLVQWQPWETFVGAFHPSQVAEDDPERDALRGEDAEEVRAILARLNERNRTALVLREYGDLSYDEIAKRLVTTRSAVKSLLTRARNEFAEHWNRRPGADRQRERPRAEPRTWAGRRRTTWGVSVDPRKKTLPWRASPWDASVKTNRWLGCFATQEEAQAAVDAWRAERGLL